MTNESLLHLFSRYGTVEDAYIIFDNKTLKSKLFGYVVFETAEEAEKVIELKFIKHNTRKIWVKLHEKPSQIHISEPQTQEQDNTKVCSGSNSSTSGSSLG